MLKKTTKIILLSIFLFSIFLLPATANAGTTCKAKEGGSCTVGNVEIRYMGIDATGQRRFIIKTVDFGTDPRYLDSPFLTDYIAQVYKYTITVATVLSTIVIIFAGVLWITSAGNQEQIGRAKKLIARAVTGLLLAVGSYTILWTINPQLVEFGSLKILRVARVDIVETGIDDQDKDYSASKALTAKYSPVVGAAGRKYTTPYFGQGENKEPHTWGGKQYGDCGATYTEAACGPTSIAMVLTKLGRLGVDPFAIGTLAVETGARICGKGTAMTDKFIKSIENKYNVVVESVDHAKARELLQHNPSEKEGAWLIQPGEQIGFTGQNTLRHRPNGHYLVYTGSILVGETKIYTINDSGKQNSELGITYKTEDQFNANKRKFIYIHNP